MTDAAELRDRVAELQPDGSVRIGPRGVVRVAALLRVARGHLARADGAEGLSGDYRWLSDVLRAAAIGYAAAGTADVAAGPASETTGRPVVITVPSSGSVMTARQVADLHNVTQSAVTKAIRAGRLPARRHGREWLIRELDARQLKVRRSPRALQAGAEVRAPVRAEPPGDARGSGPGQAGTE